MLDCDACRDAVGIEGIVLWSTMLDADAIDETPYLAVADGCVGIVLRQQHDRLPADSLPRDRGGVSLEQRLRQDERERMVGRLPGCGRPLRRIGDDRVGRLVDLDVDRLDAVKVADSLWLRPARIDDRLEGTRRLVLIEPEFEVHGVDREGIAAHAKFEIERALAIGARLVQPVDCQRIAKDVPRPQKAGQRPAAAHHGDLGRERRRCPLAIGELVPGSDGAEGNVVRDHHPDRRLDLLDRATKRRRIGGGAGHGPMVHVVDGVCAKGEHFSQPAADFVDEHHHAERGIPVEAALAGGGDRHGIEIVVAKLTGRPALGRVIAKIRAVGIPLADGRGVGRDRLLDCDRSVRPQADAPVTPGRGRRAERFPSQYRRGVGP